MARLKRFVYAYWYGLRWPHLARMLAIFGFGLFLLGGGVVHLMGPNLPDEPQHLRLEAVVDLLGKSSPRHVAFQARLDFSKRIYETGWVPYWGNCPPSEIRPLPGADAPADAFEKLLGCRVTVAGPLKPAGRVGTEKKGRRTLAEVPGTKGRVWVLSQAFAEADPGEARWLARQTYSGILSAYEAKRAAFVVHDGSDRFSDERTRAHRSSYYWVPVEATRNSIFVRATPELERTFAGTVSGVLEPHERSDHVTRGKGYRDFSAVTGEELPARYGLIRYASAKEYRDGEITIGWPFVLFGALIAAAGLAGLALFFAAPGLIVEAWKRAGEEIVRS